MHVMGSRRYKLMGRRTVLLDLACLIIAYSYVRPYQEVHAMRKKVLEHRERGMSLLLMRQYFEPIYYASTARA